RVRTLISLSWNRPITLPTVRTKAIAITTAFLLEEKSQSTRCGPTRIRIPPLRRSKDTSRSIPTESMRSQSNFQRPVSHPKAASRCLGTSLRGNLEYFSLTAAAFHSCSHGRIGIAEQDRLGAAYSHARLEPRACANPTSCRILRATRLCRAHHRRMYRDQPRCLRLG